MTKRVRRKKKKHKGRSTKKSMVGSERFKEKEQCPHEGSTHTHTPQKKKKKKSHTRATREAGTMPSAMERSKNFFSHVNALWIDGEKAVRSRERSMRRDLSLTVS